VLRADVVLLQFLCLRPRELQHFLESRRERDGTRRSSATTTHDFPHTSPYVLGRDVQRPQCLCGHTVPVGQHSQQYVFRSEVGVAEPPGLVLRAVSPSFAAPVSIVRSASDSRVGTADSARGAAVVRARSSASAPLKARPWSSAGRACTTPVVRHTSTAAPSP
jgi:hypothetical protein